VILSTLGFDDLTFSDHAVRLIPEMCHPKLTHDHNNFEPILLADSTGILVNCKFC